MQTSAVRQGSVLLGIVSALSLLLNTLFLGVFLFLLYLSADYSAGASGPGFWPTRLLPPLPASGSPAFCGG